MDALAALTGARVRRIEWIASQLLAISLDAGCALVIGTSRDARGVGLVARAPRGATSNALVHALRARLADAALRDAQPLGAALLLTFAGTSGDTTLACIFDGHAGAFAACDQTGRILAVSGPAPPVVGASFAPPPARRPLVLADSLQALEATGASLLAAGAAAEIDARRRALSRIVARAADKLARRLAAIDDDLQGLAEADVLRRQASLLLAAAHGTPHDASALQVEDDAETPPRTVSFVLPTQPGGRTGPRAVVAVAESMFARARKRETAARIGAERRADTARTHAALAALAARIVDAPDDDALRPLAEAAHALGVPGTRAAVEAPTTSQGGSRRPPVAARVPYRRFVSADGHPLLVGRGARDNDALTLHHARPHDLWLHARGVPGAHVVVPLARGERCPDARLLDAATLAAHFSDARGETLVDVQHAERRHVRKPRGSAPGAVVVDRERVLVLRHEPARLARLLRSETLAGDVAPAAEFGGRRPSDRRQQ